MADLNKNSKNVKFNFKGSQQKPYCPRYEYYDVNAPEGMGRDEILSAVLEQGYKTQREAAWYEPYANVYENTLIDYSNGHTAVARPTYELIITYPNLD